jgi:hypothetical protein
MLSALPGLMAMLLLQRVRFEPAEGSWQQQQQQQQQ